MAFTFPTSPANGDTHTQGGILYRYNSTLDQWIGTTYNTDGGVRASLLDILNTGTDGQVLSLDSDSDAFRWVDQASGGGAATAPVQANFVAAGASGTFVVPASVSQVSVFAIGGGGGGVYNAHGRAAAGGAGGVGFLLAQSVVPGETITYTCGIGGSSPNAIAQNSTRYSGGTGVSAVVTTTNWTMTATGGTGGSVVGNDSNGSTRIGGTSGSVSTTGTIDASGGLRSTTGGSTDYGTWINFWIAGSFAAQDVIGPIQAQTNQNGTATQTWVPTETSRPGVLGSRGQYNSASAGAGAGGGVIFIYN